MFTVYTKDGCPQCDKAKAMLTLKNEPHQSVKIGSDITLEAFRQAYPLVKSVPFIVTEDKLIGGIHELSKLLTDK